MYLIIQLEKLWNKHFCDCNLLICVIFVFNFQFFFSFSSNFQSYDTFTNDTNDSIEFELFYRHSTIMTAVYCIAYFIVFSVGLIGNSFVIAVVFRAPRMRTVTNFFIVNLAVADILVIVFCLPATLMSNIFVRKYIYNWKFATIKIKSLIIFRLNDNQDEKKKWK
jgi:hypothetical protein